MQCKQIAAGIIFCDGKMLIAQRKKGKQLEYFWELPGGKLEEGETLEDCLRREMVEEMDLKVDVGELFMRTIYNYDFGAFAINAFFAKTKSQSIPKICEHEQYKWVKPDEALQYKLSPADIPIVESLAKAYFQKKLKF